MDGIQIAVVLGAALVSTLCYVPLAKRLAWYIGAIDMPTSRRINKAPVPRCGGIALYLGLCTAWLVYMICAGAFGWQFHDLYRVPNINIHLLFAGITVIFATGLVDDITQLSARTKLIWQIVASCIVVASGVTIGSVGLSAEDYISLGWADAPITVIYLIIFMNVINLIDGLDGLASGVVIIISAAMLYMVMQRGSFLLVLVCVAIIGVCLAFLRYNFFPASVFMGDSGALMLGLIVGIVSIMGIVRTQSFVVMLVPLLIAGVPLVDAASAFIRRLRAHKSVSEADLGHVHHRLMRAGLSQKRSVAVLWLCSLALAVVGCAVDDLTGPVVYVILAMSIVVIFMVIWRFGLFKPTLRHYYDNLGKKGPRFVPPAASGGAGTAAPASGAASASASPASASASPASASASPASASASPVPLASPSSPAAGKGHGNG